MWDMTAVRHGYPFGTRYVTRRLLGENFEVAGRPEA